MSGGRHLLPSGRADAALRKRLAVRFSLNAERVEHHRDHAVAACCNQHVEQLALVELEIVRAWGDLLRGLKNTDDHGEALLDHTSVLLTSNLGNASSHDNRNMPVLFAGGGFRHGQHLAFDRKNNYPLPNLFVSMLQRMGIEADRFATSTGAMRGLEMA